MTDATKPLALFFKDDSAIGFYMRSCDRASLHATIAAGMFVDAAAAGTLDGKAEVDEIETVLLASGRMEFEDGWIELRTGVDDVAAFLMEKLAEAKAEEQHADAQRYLELQGRKAAEAAYGELRGALHRAIGNGAKAAALRYTIDNPAAAPMNSDAS